MNIMTKDFIKASAPNFRSVTAGERALLEFHFDTQLERDRFTEAFDTAYLHAQLFNIGRTRQDKKLDEFCVLCSHTIQKENCPYETFMVLGLSKYWVVRFEFETQEAILAAFYELIPLLDLNLYTKLWSIS